MRLAVLGQGSIGRMHAALLLAMGHSVTVYDPDPDASCAVGTRRVSSESEALDGAGAAVIATPSSKHVGQARRAMESGVPVMVEKPLAVDMAGAAELECLAASLGVMLVVGMSLRHHPAIKALAERVRGGAIGEVRRVSAWCGSWLPGWRPGTDYRQSYSAHEELGGGVLLDVAVHELDYLLWLFGPAASVTALTGRVSDLEIDVEDVASIALHLRSGAIAHVGVDYVDLGYHRGCRIEGSRATLHWSWEDERLVAISAEAGRSESNVPSDVTAAYRGQIDAFLAAVRGETAPAATAGEARQVLEVVDAARRSAAHGRRVMLAPPFQLSPAGPDDAADLLSWRNDPYVRQASFRTAEVTEDEHARWLARVLDDPRVDLWIVKTSEGRVGQVRVDRRDDGTAEIHIGLAQEARGRGLAPAVVVEAAGRALADPRTERLIARIKPDNDASLRTFARCGFHPMGNDDQGVVLVRAQA